MTDNYNFQSSQAMKRRKNATTIRELLKSSMAPSALLFFHHVGEATEKPSDS